jgi:hypothetical protein
MGGYFIAETKPAIMTAEKTMFKSRNMVAEIIPDQAWNFPPR